jgi:hypothetical protein
MSLLLLFAGSEAPPAGDPKQHLLLALQWVGDETPPPTPGAQQHLLLALMWDAEADPPDPPDPDPPPEPPPTGGGGRPRYWPPTKPKDVTGSGEFRAPVPTTLGSGAVDFDELEFAGMLLAAY